MSLDKCLPDLVESGDLTQEQADRFFRLYGEWKAGYKDKMSDAAASAKASEDTLKQISAEAAQRKRQAVLQVRAQQRILENVTKFRGYDGRKGEAFVAVLAPSDKAPYEFNDVATHEDVIHTQALGMMNAVLEKFSRNAVGRVRNIATLSNVVRELFGEDSADETAKELAKAWSDTAEMLRTRFNSAGGGIGKLEGWGLPQTHNMQAVRSATYDEWRNFIRPLLDVSKMRDSETGLPITPQQLEAALPGIRDNIASDGWATRKPGTLGGSGKLANRHADARFLVFKDTDSWLAYMNRFGRPQSTIGQMIDPSGPIFDAMFGHLRSMSRDIAQMEILGPNPKATVKWMDDTIRSDAAKRSDGNRFTDDAEKKYGYQLNDVFAVLNGSDRSPVNSRIGTIFGTLRAWQTASKLGSAVVSATTDMGFQAVTRRFNGMPITGALGGYLRQFNPASSNDREMAARVGFGAMDAARSAVAQSRYVGEVMTGEVASRLAQGVLTASGLSAWTDAGKKAFTTDFLSYITGERGKAWQTLNKRFRASLERYGFSSDDWDAIRSTPLLEHEGSSWIHPSNIEDARLRDKLLGMILTEQNYAVPETDIRTRAIMNTHLPARGTLWGEIIRSPLQFKAFGVSMLMTHGRRMMEQQGGWNKLAYAAGLAVSTTLLGALAMQAKNLLRGEDAQPMGEHYNDPAFWGAAFFQGGGFGLAGDFLNSATDRNQNSLLQYAAGPVASDAINAIKTTKDLGVTAYSVATGNPNTTHPGRDLTRMIQSDTPGSSLWYGKLAFNRAVLDQIQMQIDPDYASSFNRMEQRAQQGGQDYWWRPGEMTPGRVPDLTNAGTSPPPHQ